MDMQESRGRGVYVAQCYLSANLKLFDMTPHQHGFLEFNYQVDGRSRYEVDGRVFELPRGTLLILDSRLPHRKIYLPGQPGTLLGFTVYVQQQPGAAAGPPLDQLLEGCPALSAQLTRMDGSVLIPQAEAICIKLESMLEEYAGAANRVHMTAILTECLFLIDGLLAGRRPHSAAEQLHKRYAEIIRIHINENYRDIRGIGDIESRMGLNGTYLERIFHSVTGDSIWQYLIRRRLQEAARLLSDTDTPIGDIDEKIGMNSRQTFYLQFKQRYGVSPSAYRRQCRAARQAPAALLPPAP